MQNQKQKNSLTNTNVKKIEIQHLTYQYQRFNLTQFVIIPTCMNKHHDKPNVRMYLKKTRPFSIVFYVSK